ncbi:MAG: efflux RND transporter permease subunit [Escherichia coli]
MRCSCRWRSSGVTGQFYKQFAVTIAISTGSAINSLTLSPALAAPLLCSRREERPPHRLIDRLFGWIFRPFNRFFRSSNGYQGWWQTLGRRGAVFAVYLLLLCAAGVMFKAVPGGFIPTQISCISLAQKCRKGRRWRAPTR